VPELWRFWLICPPISIPEMKLVRFCLSLASLLLAPQAFPQSQTNLSLVLFPPGDQGVIRLSAAEKPGHVYRLIASTNLSDWSWTATLHDRISLYPDPLSAQFPARFYKLEATAKTAVDDWKNQVAMPEDDFVSGYGDVMGPDFRWIKFSILTGEPVRVYYQNSSTFKFHYDFARARLEPFRNMSPAQFDQVSLRTNGQQVLLGTVLVPPMPHSGEYGIQFTGADPYPPEFIARYFELVRSTVSMDANAQAYYVPTYEQARVAEANQVYFEQRGIRLASAEKWITGDYVYSPGWALGRLKYFPGWEIDLAFRDGRLKPEDILLTDSVPAEVPVLAGLLSLRPSTPNSHPAILARSYGLPFAYLSDPGERARVGQLSGKEILLRVDPYFGGGVAIVELAGDLSPALREEILDLKKPPVLHIAPKARYGAYAASTEDLTPADLPYFGGKASNYGFLRRAIPGSSKEAIGISFDLWDEFLDQVMPGGRALRELIGERLSAHSYPPDMALLHNDLEAIRLLITGQAQFTDGQKAGIIAALEPFDPLRKIRFRSSTNVEDSEQFTGAGLYDSYSGCLQDDVDGDDRGPSKCDPAQPKERGVFRAIQRVYASFYNQNAFLERLRHNVDESKVGMALLVHHSAPDEVEMANGVATMDVERGGSDGGQFPPPRAQTIYNNTAQLVTQKGAESVSNPDGSAQPEVVTGYLHPFGSGAFLTQRSSLVPLGAYVLDWDSEYKELMSLFASVADAYHRYYPAKDRFVLDFEYKKLDPGVLDVKQVREIPAVSGTNLTGTFLLNSANDYWVYQGEAADVFSNHRLKSFWAFQTRNLKMSGTNLAGSLYANAEVEYLDGATPQLLSGPFSSFPKARHSSNDHSSIDGWTIGTGADQREYELHTELKLQASPDQSPALTLKDLRVVLSVDFATPQPALEYSFDGPKPALVDNHSVVLEPRRVLISTNYLQKRTFSAGQLEIETSFYWPKPPDRGIGDKTAPLAKWRETQITGLSSEPIMLRGEYSQTYRPGHHNFTEEFIFEPGLEQGLPSGVLEELEAANVRLIYALWYGEFAFPGDPPSLIMILGTDGKFRRAR
jgi:hypothetical protein